MKQSHSNQKQSNSQAASQAQVEESEFFKLCSPYHDSVTAELREALGTNPPSLNLLVAFEQATVGLDLAADHLGTNQALDEAEQDIKILASSLIHTLAEVLRKSIQ